MTIHPIATLIDGDNIGAAHADRIRAIAANRGRLDVLRVYAGAHPSCDWLNAPGYRLIHAGAGKNAADVLLCIDAMELALTNNLQSFVIATSDGDFTHLAHRLRERGLNVLGLGEEKAPESFRLACSEFIQLETHVKVSVAPSEHNGADFIFDQQIRTMIQQHSKKALGMRLADLANEMRKAHGTQISSYPEGNWRGYLSKRPALYDLDPPSRKAMVRYRPQGFAALPL